MDAGMLWSRNLPRRACIRIAAGALTLPLIGRAAASGQHIRIGGSGAGFSGLMLLGPIAAEQGVILQAVTGLGTLGGIRAVRAGQLDIAVSARAASPAESQNSLRAVEYARTPVVFATHPDTAAQSLGLREAIGMIDGTITHWPDGMLVRVSRRPDLDGDTRILASLSPDMAAAVAAMQRRAGVFAAGTDHDQAEALEAQPGTLGVLSLSLILCESRRLKTLPLREPPPSPMLKSLFAVTRADAPPKTEAFLGLIWSEDARRILAAHGNFPLPAA